MKPSQLSGFLFSFMKIVGSSIFGRNSAVLVGGSGNVGGLGATDADEDGEQMTDAEAYGTIGVVFRPRPPETVDGQVLAAEAMALRTGAGLVPIAWRDLRLHRKFSAPKPGTVAFVGYGGGFFSFDDALSGQSSIGTLYIPYAIVNGVATKALCIAIDPTSESIQIIHGDGYAVTLDKNNGFTVRADATTWFNMQAGQATLVASKIVLQGNVVVGANPAGAVPLLAGPASPPCPSLFVSAV